jgi:hypothetical protein
VLRESDSGRHAVVVDFSCPLAERTTVFRKETTGSRGKGVKASVDFPTTQSFFRIRWFLFSVIVCSMPFQRIKIILVKFISWLSTQGSQ